MAVKLSSRQQAQLSFLQTLPPKLQRIRTVIELMAVMQADETAVRGMTRALDEIKAGAGALNLGSVADLAGLMSTMARRGGGWQMKVRGLRELFGGLKINYEGAVKAASTPEAADQSEPPTQP